MPFSKDAGRLDAVQDGHVQVEQDGVGPVLGDQVDGFLAIGGGGHYLYVGEKVEQEHEPLAHAGLVVSDHDPQRRRRLGHCGTWALTTHCPSRRPASASRR